ncbi:MAG: 4Fe-4S dicluster domain-containing protein [SAR324 cluster bacterium]|nr:4Fe-4S dicluster domain-containing protein [SAR324 cluster bacterium]
MSDPNEQLPENSGSGSSKAISRRKFFKKASIAGATVAATTAMASTPVDGDAFTDAVQEFFQGHYQKMTKEEVADAIARLERKTKRKYGVDIQINNEPPLEGVLFGYALNISKCKGYRKCVTACMEENNTSRTLQIQYIRVLEMDKGSMNIEESNHYYDSETVPQEGKMYLPIQCHHCENPPCVRACPTKATWKEDDGIVVIDYNWCIGCHYCVVACPYWARRFNWEDPDLPPEKINPVTHYLGNRPRERGVMEKCTFCVQRTRKGKLPACLEACPTGARVFGNLLDPNSEIRYILENKTVFRLKEELNTNPKFWYYTD